MEEIKILGGKNLEDYLKIWNVMVHVAYVYRLMLNGIDVPDRLVNLLSIDVADAAYVAIKLGLVPNEEVAIASLKEGAAHFFDVIN